MAEIEILEIAEKGDPGPAPIIRGTSSTPHVPGTGEETFETQPGISWSPSQRLRAASLSDGMIYMSGFVVSYDTEDGTLVLDVTRAQGEGSHTDWSITIAGDPGLSDGDMLKSIYDADDDGKVGAAVAADNVPWAGVSGKPATFPPDTHTHPISEVTSLQTSLNAKAPLASPNLTGTPTAPTAGAATNSQQLATTAFVQAVVAALVNGAPGVLDQINEIATALGNDPNFAATITTALAGKQPLDADLTAIAALTATGILRRTGPDAWAAGGQVATAEVADKAVTAAKMEDIPTSTISGRATAGTGPREVLTVAQAKALLNYVVADVSGLQAALDAKAAKSQVDPIAVYIATPANKDYRIVLDAKAACTINEITTRCESGSCTVTGKINATALGGTANAASTTEQTQAHATAFAVAVGDDVVLTISANAACAGLSINIKTTRTLA